MQHSDTARDILNRIDDSRTDLVDFLSRFIQQPSEAPKDGAAQVRDCQSWLAAELGRWDWPATIDLWEASPDEPNIAIRIRGRSGVAGLMFNGHADVVPVHERDTVKWRVPPYSGRIERDRVWGRGASDMKGGVAAFLWAARMVAEAGAGFENDLLLTVNIGEESARPEIGVSSVLGRGYTAPLVVNAEPTNLLLCPAAMGWMFFEIEIAGKRTHPANRHLCIDPSIPVAERPGIDANDKMRLVMNALADLGADWRTRARHYLAPPYSNHMTLVALNGGERSASLADQCRATYAVVFDPSMTAADVEREIRECIDALARNDDWLADHPPSVAMPVIDPLWKPMETSPEAPGIADLVAAVRTASGTEPTIGCFPGPCDANVIAETGVETVILGPGDLSFGCHGIDEYIPIDQLLGACRIYASLILKRCCA